MIQAATAAPAPKAVVIRLSDLMPGYGQETARALRRTHVGQVRGYETAFNRVTYTDIATIDDVAWSYRSRAYAMAGYRRTVRALLAHRPFKHSRWRRLSTPRIGDRRTAYTTAGTAKGLPTHYATVIFHRKRMIGEVTIDWVGKKVQPRSVFHFARIMDRRMRG